MTKTPMDKVKMFPLAFGVAAVGFPIAALFTGGALLLGIGSSSEPTRQGFGAAIALMGAVAVLVLGVCAVLAFLLQLCGMAFPVGFLGSYSAVCAAFALLVCLDE